MLSGPLLLPQLSIPIWRSGWVFVALSGDSPGREDSPGDAWPDWVWAVGSWPVAEILSASRLLNEGFGSCRWVEEGQVQRGMETGI